MIKNVNPPRRQSNPKCVFPKNRDAKFVKQKLRELKGQTDKSRITVRDFPLLSLSTID